MTHSSPTRRSSDMIVNRQELNTKDLMIFLIPSCSAVRQALKQLCGDFSSSSNRIAAEVTHNDGDDDDGGDGDYATVIGCMKRFREYDKDRKSPCLNSSH